MVMKFAYRIILYICLFQFLSCGEQHLAKKFTLSIDQPKAVYQRGDIVKVNLELSENVEFQQVKYSIQNKSYERDAENTALEIPTDDLLLGKHQLKAKIQVGEETLSIDKWIKLYNDKKPALYTFNIINTYPHDKSSYTQGLEFHQDTLYEGTGQKGRSRLMKMDLETGEVHDQIRLNDRFFGEGITIMNDQVYQLTWRSNVGFIYDAQSLEEKRSFSYNKSKEGWGICNDGKHLFKSDGTPKIWRLDPETLEEIDHIQPTTHNRVADELNELEWIKGKIYANMYQKDGVLIIDPSNGAVEGVIDFRALKEKVDVSSPESVLNGIAYKAESDQLFVTGKNWDKLFEVEIIPKTK